jgi:hypothetical protein
LSGGQKKLLSVATAFLVVEHDMLFTRDLCSRRIVPDRGAIIAGCVPRELQDNPRRLWRRGGLADLLEDPAMRKSRTMVRSRCASDRRNRRRAHACRQVSCRLDLRAHIGQPGLDEIVKATGNHVAFQHLRCQPHRPGERLGHIRHRSAR